MCPWISISFKISIPIIKGKSKTAIRIAPASVYLGGILGSDAVVWEH